MYTCLLPVSFLEEHKSKEGFSSQDGGREDTGEKYLAK